MKIDKNLIAKFLSGECTEEEKEYIHKHLKSEPWKLEQFFPSTEWDSYVNELEEDSEINNELLNSDYNAVRQSAIVKPKRIRAAALLLLTGLMVFGVFTVIKKTGSTVQQKELATVAPVSSLKQIDNPTQQNLKITLQDGSTVILFPSAIITYDSVQFNLAKRDIQLIGKAEFSVEKNKSKPFTVFCGNVSTTALGTRFLVEGSPTNIRVTLFEGEVLVNSLSQKSQNARLLPGEDVNYIVADDVLQQNHNIAKGGKNINEDLKNEPEKNNQLTKAEAPLDVDDDANETNTEAKFVKFKNTNFKTVIDKLSAIYKVEIIHPTDIASSINLYLSVDTSQSIEDILKNITSINNLGLKKLDDHKFLIFQKK